MKIVLSRKGFDSSSGGGPSPVVDGRPLSLPIPASKGMPGPSYASLGMAHYVEEASGGSLGGEDKAHLDPMFRDDGTCLFGQCSAAQTHLENQGVGPGDLFLFFGLFREGKERPHHRIFGWMWVEEVVRHGDPEMEQLAKLGHPHALTPHGSNDAIWVGRGTEARSTHPELRLSEEGGPPSFWRVPPWLERVGLSYHDKPERWLGKGRLQSVARGQEFVADIGNDEEAHEWAHRVLALMN
ncbi:hypothetical protein [Alteraurantiacibacter aquimixticola]|uniref:Nucleotide modification associated domain-containing protein n=1 Tax=Alteraurantiacibacter aquimixticola TaxID=2489173 RepID=A0A4T3EXW0_9SPHN|nr:hypothetical protein [Alteraurantiacibacter aquimixticola]TIX49469.1 hypothetical protein E5222_11490 [Alteraurantiacibacter aquimixticola]